MRMVISTLMTLAIVATTSASTPIATKLSPVVEPLNETPTQKIQKSKWICPECSSDEQFVLAALQEHTKISDRNALATIMGNIQQESKFISNICEGGARVSYQDCLRGGYGLIQWTSINRYKGLGNFAVKYSCNPSEIDCQVRWMINEPIFQRVLPQFEGGGQTVSYYMRPAYTWLGWGIKGNRELYAYDFTKKMINV